MPIRGGVEYARPRKARGQGQRHKKKSVAKDSPSEDRPFRGQGQECSRPRTKDTGTSVLQKKKRSSKTFFRRSPKEENKKGLRKYSPRFPAFSNDVLTILKIVLSSSQGQDNFRGLEVSRLRTSKCILKDSTSDAYHLIAPTTFSNLPVLVEFKLLTLSNCFFRQGFTLGIATNNY